MRTIRKSNASNAPRWRSISISEDENEEEQTSSIQQTLADLVNSVQSISSAQQTQQNVLAELVRGTSSEITSFSSSEMRFFDLHLGALDALLFRLLLLILHVITFHSGIHVLLGNEVFSSVLVVFILRICFNFFDQSKFVFIFSWSINTRKRANLLIFLKRYKTLLSIFRNIE